MIVKSAADMLLNKTYEEVWHRGEGYADEGRVIMVRVNDQKVEALVEGTNGYVVSLRFVANGIRRHCSCPYPKDICKHMVAVAILWDEMRGMKRPSDREIESFTIAPASVSGQSIDALFNNPLRADLDAIRVLVEYTAFPSRRKQTHAKLPKHPKREATRILKEQFQG
ncbi:SWIM zinc finger family protein [Patescibacteria group bacterium AH-259-L07]|nr:SWIM zinc finger family protein [Patescibacteria group bacterium AH-259-L07]